MIFSPHSDAKQAVEKLNTKVKNLGEFFESHQLIIKTDETEIIVLSAYQKATHNLKTSDYRSKIKPPMSQNLKKI